MEVTVFWLPVCNGMQIKEWDFCLSQGPGVGMYLSLLMTEMSKVFVPTKGLQTDSPATFL